MELYKLLINGTDVDTGLYKYMPYAEAAIKDPVGALRAQRSAKSGDVDLNFIYAKYCVADEKTIKDSLAAAHAASLIFRDFSFSKRVRIMNDIYELLLMKKNILIELMINEGHPRALAEWEFSGMDLAYRPESINYFKTLLRGSHGENEFETTGWIRKADGVVCVSPPGNAACSNSLTAGFGLLGGNALVVKPPLRAPIATLFLWRNVIWEALKKHNAPPGTVNTIVGNSNLIMETWLNSPLVNDVFFFGDSEMGISIGSRAFAAGKKPILELSGNDMLLVWKDADMDRAVCSLMDAFLGSTQICMVPKKALIHEDIYEDFENRFVSKVKELKIALPTDPMTYLTPVVKIDEFFEFLKDALNKGADLLCGGERVDHNGEKNVKGVYLLPSVLRINDSNMAASMKCIEYENFFPLIPLIKISSENGQHKDRAIFEKMVRLVNSNKYGLRTSVWVDSSFYMGKFIKSLDRSGLLRINSRHTGFSARLTTHGGPGLSGGPFGEANHIWQKTTHLQNVSIVRKPTFNSQYEH